MPNPQPPTSSEPPVSRDYLDDLSEASGVQPEDVFRVMRAMVEQQALGHALLQANVGLVGVRPDLGLFGAASHFVDVSNLNRSMVAIVHFHGAVDRAALLMSHAFAEAQVKDFKAPARLSPIKTPDAEHGWYTSVLNSALSRFREVRNALVHRWTPTPEAEILYSEAFNCLVGLTPAAKELTHLWVSDRARASSELVRLLDPIADGIVATERLRARLSEEGTSEAERLEAAQRAVLASAGDSWTLKQASEALGMSRQALHKHVRTGAVLGVMQGSRLALPMAQFKAGVKTRRVEGLAPIVKMFREAGAGEWSALQFLVNLDPNIGGRPIDALWSRQFKQVEAAAAAYLGLGEG